MINRTAESLFWIGRYLERVENHSRLIDVNYHTRHFLMDSGESCEWERLITSIGDLNLFKQCFEEANEKTALQFLTFDQRNPNSLVSIVRQIRNNVRTLRQLLPSELWEDINGFYLWLNEQDFNQMLIGSPYMFFQRIRGWLAQIRGTADSAMVRDLVWNFVQAGKFFERAENLLRNMHSYLDFTKDAVSLDHQANYSRLMILLKSAGGYEPYRKLYADNVTLAKVIEFLISNNKYPYSVKYALNSLEKNLTTIKQQDYQFDLLAERAIDVVAKIHSVLADLQRKNEVLIGLKLIQAMLESVNKLGAEISNTFFQEEFVEA